MDTGPERLAVIDLGSNTTRLVVLDYVPGQMFKLVDEIRERVRLAEGMGRKNILRAPAIERAVTTMAMFRAFCDAHGIRHILPVATSAVRDARNRDEFLEAVATRAGLQMRVLTGAEEAYYGALGALNSTALEDGFVLDIGGGSAQVVAVRDRRVVQSASLPLGTVRLTEQFLHSDPVSAEEYKALEHHLREALEPLDWFRARKGLRLIGLGGTIRNLAKLDHAERQYPLRVLHGYTLPAENVTTITHRLRRLSIARRAELPGLKDDRADVILPGAVLLRRLLELSGFEELTICGHGVREGVFFEWFLREQDQPVLANVREFSVHNLARQYHYNAPHAAQVTRLALSLFDQLSPRAPVSAGRADRDLLWAAACLHDIGTAVEYRNHHEHGEYLLLTNGLDGYTHRELALIALLVRYHRGGTPTLAPYDALLTSDDRVRVHLLAGILRLAEYLERGRRQIVTDIACRFTQERLTLTLRTAGDARIELWEANRHVGLLEKALGLRVVVQ